MASPFTFHLPQNILWHDGQPFMAEDVSFSYDTVLNPDINNSYQSQVSPSPSPTAWSTSTPSRLRPRSGRHLPRRLPGHHHVSMPRTSGRTFRPPVAERPGSTGEDTTASSAPVLQIRQPADRRERDAGPNDQYWADTARHREFTVRIVPDSAAEVQALKGRRGSRPRRADRLRQAQGDRTPRA